MNTKKIWANLAVSDLKRTTDFYKHLGFKPNTPHNSSELTSFMVGDDDFVIHFFIKPKLTAALKGKLANLKKGNEILFTLWADSIEEVDRWGVQVQQAGGTLISEPESFGEGYYGFVFADPDGHKFNVFHM